MTDARTLTLRLGGRWHCRYGAAPCPVCQPERRRGQNALTLADGRAGLLLHCKRLGCDFRDIATAAGITPGAFAPPDPEAIARPDDKGEEADDEEGGPDQGVEHAVDGQALVIGLDAGGEPAVEVEAGVFQPLQDAEPCAHGERADGDADVPAGETVDEFVVGLGELDRGGSRRDAAGG